MASFNVFPQRLLEMRPAKTGKSLATSVYRLDTANQCLWRKNHKISLDPKAYAVLLYLVENPERIVTKDELLDAIWPREYVCEAVIKFQISRIRAKLRETPKASRFIETVHRRGYRFVGRLTEAKQTTSLNEALHSHSLPAQTLGQRYAQGSL